MIKCQDKKKCNWTSYVEDGWGLTLDTFTYNDAGYIKSWTLYGLGTEYTGETVVELLGRLNEIKAAYDLQVHDEHHKDVLIIYTDFIRKLYYFLKAYGVHDDFMTEDDKIFYFQVLDNIEFRECWYDDITTAKGLSEYASFMIEEVFKPDKYFYITPNQIPRKRMKKAKTKNDTIASEVYPKSYDSYKSLKKAFFGGILYVPYTTKPIDDPMIEIDINSDYIYQMLMRKHCMSAKRKVNTEDWEYYLDSITKNSEGKYKIKYSSYSKKITCYKNSDGQACQLGENVEDTFTFTNVDLKIFLENVHVHWVECLYLYEYDVDYLPKYVRDELVHEYIKKEYLKKYGNKEQARIQKVIVNGEYGDSIRKWTNEKEYKDDRKNPTLAPQWGIWTTSYGREHLLRLGNQLDGWYYSATDSIWCVDTKANREKIRKFNEEIQENIKDFCDKFGYCYEDLKNLGTFIIKHEIKKFRAFGPNTYMYTTIEGKTEVKASGCNKKELNEKDVHEIEALYEAEFVPVGSIKRYHSTDKKTSCDIDGRHYESNGSFYEIVIPAKYADLYVFTELAIESIN